MLNRFLMLCSEEFRVFFFATALLIGFRAVLTTSAYDTAAVFWSFTTIVVAVVGTLRNGFAKGVAAAGVPLFIVGILEPTLLPLFIIIFIATFLLAFGALLVAKVKGVPPTQSKPAQRADDAVVSVAAGVTGQDVTAEAVLSRFGLGEGSRS